MVCLIMYFLLIIVIFVLNDGIQILMIRFSCCQLYVQSVHSVHMLTEINKR